MIPRIIGHEREFEKRQNLCVAFINRTLGGSRELCVTSMGRKPSQKQVKQVMNQMNRFK